jgi:hypothetical protein
MGPLAGRWLFVLEQLGLTTQAAVLATRFVDPNQPIQSQLGLTLGLYLAGQDEAATRLLDEARHRLFVRKVADERERTELVLAYAQALQAAPVGIALGRLEEIFQRLESIASIGSTNRYYTLNILRLLDTIVRAAVSQEATLSAGARRWLEDDELLTRQRLARDLQQELSAWMS